MGKMSWRRINVVFEYGPMHDQVRLVYEGTQFEHIEHGIRYVYEFKGKYKSNMFNKQLQVWELILNENVGD